MKTGQGPKDIKVWNKAEKTGICLDKKNTNPATGIRSSCLPLVIKVVIIDSLATWGQHLRLKFIGPPCINKQNVAYQSFFAAAEHVVDESGG